MWPCLSSGYSEISCWIFMLKVKLRSRASIWEISLIFHADLDVVPVCLPTQEFADNFVPKVATVAGYGRRESPVCTTDINGPEAFEPCGFPQNCHLSSRLETNCGLDFLYQGERKNTCLKSKPPSSFHPMCQEFANQTNSKSM